MENPLVSIITPLYNAAPFIAACIESVQKQSYPHWEQIIVDDASLDDSLEICKGFASKDPRIKWVSLKHNQGAAYCRNLATEKAQGDFIAFLDSDDQWHPEKLQKQLTFMKDCFAEVCFSSYLHVDEHGKSLGKRIVAIPKLSFRKQLLNNYIGNLTGIYHATTLGKILAPNIRKRQDWAVWLEAIKRSGKPALGLQEELAYYRVREGSISSSKWRLVRYNFQFYREHLGYSWLKSVGYLLRFFWEYFFVRPKYIQKL
ncbi:MAG TPA: glycosyltransferase family 2 protein [Flavobacteriaceae bacterium]|nr:glycosyltransferase family 2 protein [Flavobacteriaceae bacterium]MCB9211911.1 glycosyltransferase family 2 protein [Alteromonas sp.]HPF09995.1 glycosyltransferase family 2 protein [Flavobacteriaceae bacterium]HQU20092.1 glycosyltransferase family 2 protein [Flavobacteriaceae bacterium]HQU63922.1 glycosyltransferase family 2 protein [Flavobacteriaceae bacterium]